MRSTAIALEVVATGAGAAVDLLTRRIPSAISLVTAVAGVVLAAAGQSGITVGAALTGFAFGMVVMLPGHVWGATGAGDVKLMGAIGAILGPAGVLRAFLYTAIAGGIVAMAIALARGRLTGTLLRTARLVTARRGAGTDTRAQGAASRFPYGPAIAIGSTLASLG
jgi:prepilin peptidase CpaA